MVSGYKESVDSIIIIVVDSILAVMKLLIITCDKTHTHTHTHFIISLPPFSSGGRYVIVPILQMWKPRFGEVKSQAQVTQPELMSQDSPGRVVISGGHKVEQNEGNQSVYCYEV